MAQQQQRIPLPLVGALLLFLLAGVYLLASRRFSRPDPPAAIIKHTVETRPEDTLKYWTADKMRQARPVKLPKVKAPGRRKQRQQRPPDESQPQHAD